MTMNRFYFWGTANEYGAALKKAKRLKKLYKGVYQIKREGWRYSIWHTKSPF